jgi:hypothetical protein
MKSLLIGFILMASASAHAGAAELQAEVTRSDGWVAWRVPMVAGAGIPCCPRSQHASTPDAACNLDAHTWSFGDDKEQPQRDSALVVYAQVEHAHIDHVRALASSCTVASAAAIRWIDTVEPAQSVSLLSAWLDAADGRRADADSALAALAYHADATATRALAALAQPQHARAAREQALFWLGQTRGIDGAQIVERYATTDADPKLREKAIFALSQSHAGDTYAKIAAISHSDPTASVRSQALFWMAQTEDARASADITTALASEQSADVREQAVFALSQLKDGQAEDALIAIVRGNYPREDKKKALFWLGQSGSPRALQMLDEVLAKGKSGPRAASD